MSTPTKTFGIALTNQKISKALFNENPAWLWAPEADSILWSNEAGCRFFGTKSIADLLSRSFRRISPATIEIARVGKSTDFSKTKLRKLKFLRGMKSVSVSAELTHIKLMDGSTGVLVEVDAPEKKFDDKNPEKNIRRFMKLFSRSSLGVALLSAKGELLEASNDFKQAEASKSALRKLARALEEDNVASMTLDSNSATITGYALRKKKGTLVSIFAVLEKAEGARLGDRDDALASDNDRDQEDGILGFGAAVAGVAAGAAASAGDASTGNSSKSDGEDAENNSDQPATETSTKQVTLFDVDDTDNTVDGSNDALQSEGQTEETDQEETLEDTNTDDPNSADKPTRFLFEFDRDGALKSLSSEFYAAMGIEEETHIGSPWIVLANDMKLDKDGKIARHLEHQAIWTETAYWPLGKETEQSPKRVPISMTAMPVFDRNRLFEGFRGFGTMQWNDVRVHPDLDALEYETKEVNDENSDTEWETFVATTPLPGDEEPTLNVLDEDDSDPTFETDTSVQELHWDQNDDDRETERFRAELDDASDHEPADGQDNVVHLTNQTPSQEENNVVSLHGEDHKPNAQDTKNSDPGNLSKPEQKTFQQIADVLSSDINKENTAKSKSNDIKSETGESIDLAAASAIEGAGAQKAGSKSIDERAAEALDEAKPTGDDKTESRSTKVAKGLGAGAAAILGAGALKNGSNKKTDQTDQVDGIQDQDENAAYSFQPKTEKTESKAEPSFDESNEILNRLPLGLIVSRQRNILFANQAVLDFLGYNSMEEFIEAGGVNTLFKPEISTDTSGPVDGDMFKQLVLTADKQNQPITQIVRARLVDGTTARVDVRLQSGNWQGDQALLLTLSAHLEQTGENRTEEDKISRLIGQSTDVMDIASDGIIIVDDNGDVMHANASAEALFGRDRREMRHLSFTSLFAEESQRSVADYMEGLSSNGVASVLNDGREVIGREANGGLIPLFMTLGKLENENSQRAYCAVLRDITQWKRAEEELIESRRIAENANAQKSDFLAKVSHEIRTPLNAIIGFSEVMMEERFGSMQNPRYLEYARDIHNSGEHLISLVNDLLDLSKIEAGKLDLTFASIQLNDLIRESVAIMQGAANKDRIIIRTSLDDQLPNVVADARSIRQIALNLLSNAVKFTNPGGQVIVSTMVEETGEVSVRVRDTGIGMSEEDLEIALEPFRQVGADSHGRTSGTGLGLPLTKALVEANRAKFTIDSRLDYGTLIHVTFPNERVLAQ